MKRKKLLYSLLVIACAIIAAVVFTLFYIFHHPATLKTIIEKSLAAKIGAAVKIGTLQYSLRPIYLQAHNIAVNSGQSFIKIPQLTAGFELVGPFGSRKLVIKQFNLEEFSVVLKSVLQLPHFEKSPKPPSLFDRTFKWMLQYLLFKDLQIKSAKALNGFIRLQVADQQLVISQIGASLNPDRFEINGSASLLRSPEDTVVRLPHFRIVSDPHFYTKKWAIGGRIVLPEVIIQSPNVRAGGVHGHLSWSYRPDLKNLALESVSFLCRRFIFTQNSGKKIVLNNLHLEAGGILDIQQKLANILHWRLETANSFELEGKASGRFHRPFGLKIELTAGRLLSQRLLPIYRDFMGLDSMPVSVSGFIGLAGAIEIRSMQPGWSHAGELAAKLYQNTVSLSTDRIRLQGSVTGDIRVVGRLSAPDILARLAGQNVTLTGGGATIKSMAAKVSLDGTYPEFSIADLQAHVPRASLKLADKHYQMDDVQAHLKNGRFNLKTGSLTCPQIKLSSSVLKNLHISLRGQWGQMMLNFKAKNSHLLQAAAVYGLIPSNWRFSGQDTIQATAIIKHDGWSTISSKLTMTEVNFSNPDESCVAENLRVSAQSSAMIHIRDEIVKGTISLALPKGEFLCDKIYLDMAPNTFSATGNAIYNGKDRSLQFSGVKFGLLDLMALDLRGSFQAGRDRPLLDLFIKLPDTAIEPVFHHFVSEPYRYEKPALAEMQADGFISARLNVTLKGSDVTVRGNTGWHAGSLQVADTGVSLEGIELNLPVWFKSHRLKSDSEILRGRLSIQKLVIPFFPEQPLTVSLKVRPDSISTAAPARLLFQSGDVVLEPLVVSNIYDGQPSLVTGLMLNSIPIDPFLNALWPNPTGGMIHGNLELIDFNNHDISSRGTVTAEIFGGQIHVSNPGISGLFTAAPTIYSSARIRNLNLEKLTQGTAFGRIQGILTGTIENLEIVKGQPQRFDLLLNTRRKKGVPQNINVQAVENIAELGGGQSPFMGLAGKLASLFKEFSYEKIGVAASLENDVFKINGTVKENGREYIVKKGGLAGVDVVNLNPNNRIGFKDMVKRIKRIKNKRRNPVIR